MYNKKMALEILVPVSLFPHLTRTRTVLDHDHDVYEVKAKLFLVMAVAEGKNWPCFQQLHYTSCYASVYQ